MTTELELPVFASLELLLSHSSFEAFQPLPNGTQMDQIQR
jgi:hypothetical protein